MVDTARGLVPTAVVAGERLSGAPCSDSQLALGGGWLAHPSPRSLVNAAPRVVRATHRAALASAGLSPEIPEDLYCLIKKAVSVRKHLDKFRQDKDAKFRLILIESRIHRVARYYKSVKALPPTFKYESATASTLVS